MQGHFKLSIIRLMGAVIVLFASGGTPEFLFRPDTAKLAANYTETYRFESTSERKSLLPS